MTAERIDALLTRKRDEIAAETHNKIRSKLHRMFELASKPPDCPQLDQTGGCFSFTNDASLLLPTGALTGAYWVAGVGGHAAAGAPAGPAAVVLEHPPHLAIAAFCNGQCQPAIRHRLAETDRGIARPQDWRRSVWPARNRPTSSFLTTRCPA